MWRCTRRTQSRTAWSVDQRPGADAAREHQHVRFGDLVEGRVTDQAEHAVVAAHLSPLRPDEDDIDRRHPLEHLVGPDRIQGGVTREQRYRDLHPASFPPRVLRRTRRADAATAGTVPGRRRAHRRTPRRPDRRRVRPSGPDPVRAGRSGGPPGRTAPTTAMSRSSTVAVNHCSGRPLLLLAVQVVHPRHPHQRVNRHPRQQDSAVRQRQHRQRHQPQRELRAPHLVRQQERRHDQERQLRQPRPLRSRQRDVRDCRTTQSEQHGDDGVEDHRRLPEAEVPDRSRRQPVNDFTTL